MTQKKTHTEDFNWAIDGQLSVSETLGVTGATTLSDTLGVTGATTLSSTVTVGGLATLNSLKLVQAGGGTNVSGDQTWTGGNAPVVTVGMYYFTFTRGASTFRVPCWPTT